MASIDTAIRIPDAASRAIETDRSRVQSKEPIMKATRSILAGLVVATATFSAFAETAYAADEGLPQNIAAVQAAARAAAAPQQVAERFVPQVLIVPGGEITQVANPAFQAADVQRAPIRSASSQALSATTYLGA